MKSLYHHFYYFHKLPALYIDDCFDDTQLGVYDKVDTINTCADEKYLKNITKQNYSTKNIHTFNYGWS